MLREIIIVAKYYVRSGGLERIVTASTPEDAACLALARANGETIDKHFFYVDERGFRGPLPDYECIDTEFLPDFSIPMDDVFQTEGDDEWNSNLTDNLDDYLDDNDFD